MSPSAGVLSGFLLTMASLDFISGFNVDTKFPLIFGDDSRGDSYFGFSVALHENKAGKWLLSGAPRANTSFRFATESPVEPGTIFKCPVEDQSPCQEIDFLFRAIDDDLNFQSFNEFGYKEMRDNGWLGVSLDVSSIDDGPNIIACSHLWKNRRFPSSYFANGICYITDSEMKQFKKLIALNEMSKQSVKEGFYLYGFGLMGMASHFIQDSNDLIIGAPGVDDFKGTAIFSYEEWYDTKVKKKKYYIPFPSPKLPTNSYFGYSLSSGKFKKNIQSQLVAGAPRDGPTGKVYIMEIPTLDDVTFMIVGQREGTQMGEYFGAAVCAVDLNNDGLSDLLVGAPLHSVEVDEGKVYVYMNMQEGHLISSDENLFGSSIPLARFGTAISAVGDLNRDGFQDVAIGAPYEEGNGAVYIYHGSLNGLHVSQRILASELHSGLRGFGISISKGKDMDDNQFLDVAVGAYDSGQAVILRTYPVIQTKFTLQADVENINMNHLECSFYDKETFCFNITACVSFSSNKGPSEVVFANSLTIGLINHKETRGFMVSGGDPSNEIKFNLLVSKEKPSCKDYKVHILNSTVDFLKPVSFNLTSKIERNPLLLQDFCKDCPVQGTEEAASFIKALPFATDCGSDEICESDLQLKAYFSELKESSEFVIGSSRAITLKVEVENLGEPAYQTQVFLSFPRNTYLSRGSHECSVVNVGSPDVIIQCFVANPLKKNSKRELEIAVDVSQVKPSSSSLTFGINCSTTSNNVGVENNVVTVKLPLKAEGDIGIIGRTNEEQILFRSSNASYKVLLVHSFEIFKKGITPIETVQIDILIPLMLPNAEESFLDVTEVKPTVNGDLNFYDGGCNQSNYASNDFDIQRPNSNNFQLNCIDFPCKHIQCKMGPFKHQETGILSVQMNIKLNLLKELIVKHDIVDFMTYAEATILDEEFDQHLKQFKRFTEVKTQLINEGSPPQKEIEKWIIIVCVVVGMILLGIIIFVLAKFGFFRRKEKEEMEKLSTEEKLITNESTDSG